MCANSLHGGRLRKYGVGKGMLPPLSGVISFSLTVRSAMIAGIVSNTFFIPDVMATWDATTSPTLTASPYMKSKAEICYRTMPYTHEDNRLRPDLRLGESDAAVRKVAGLVRWFEGMAGLVGAA